jgi:glycosyltransferase involved in cell wall biosynthesis
VVPVGGTGPPVKVLAAMHSLNWEGAPRFEFELLTRLKQAGAIDAEIVCPRDGPMRLAYEKKGIPIRIEGRLSGLSGQPKLFPDAISALASVVKEGGYQVVHANTLEAFWAVLAARRAQVPAVWSIHESDPWQTYFDDWPPALAADALESLSYAYRVVFSATSSADRWRDLDTTGNYALARFPLDVNRFQSELAQSDRETARNTLGLAPDDFCVLLLGTICERKGQHDLFHAFRNLPPEIAARTTCLVVGYRDGIAYGRKLKDLVRSLPPERRERFRVIDETGATSPFWRAADLFCCSSRVESYPHVILEAMAAGLPIVTTPVFGIAEQVRPSVNGLFYEPGNGQKLAEHLITLATDRELRTRFAEASPWVLRGLPRDRDVDVAYERIFRAAAESTPWPIAVNALKSERLRHHGHGENTPARRPTSLVESPRRAN